MIGSDVKDKGVNDDKHWLEIAASSKREKLLEKANAALRNDPPGIFLVSEPDIWAASGKVHGLRPQSTGLLDFDK